VHRGVRHFGDDVRRQWAPLLRPSPLDRRRSGALSLQSFRVPTIFDSDRLEPMYATIGTDVPRGEEWTFEPKYDGMRALAFVSPTGVRLMTRNAKDKAAQFPEVVEALRALGRTAKRALVLAGEVVAPERNRPGHFQSLQSRFHVKAADSIARLSRELPAAMIVFDILGDGDTALMKEPWTTRRAHLERIMRATGDGVRLGETSPNGSRMLQRARRAGWEGVIAKRSAARYIPGARSHDWLKLKLQYRAEFIIGGFTEPRRTRPYLGAILLGYFDRAGRLCYVGHTGGGFDRETLREMRARLDRLQQQRCPFAVPPRTNERVHWVKPKIVVEVKFAEWTADAKLRQPIFLGLRDDKDARDVHLERQSIQRMAAAAR